MAERIRRRNLPHWDMPGATYFVTSCLEGSLPAQGLVDLAQYREELQRRSRPLGMSEAEWTNIRGKLQFARMDRWLDEQPAVRWLEQAELARIVVDAFYFYAGKHYDLLAFVVMPSHIHWVFQPREEWTAGLDESGRSAREQIVHALNLHTGREGNRLLGRHGAFWQHEGYDHWVRDTEELERILLYVEGNPVKAGLVTAPEEWVYSSAFDRQARGIVLGEALIRAS